MRAAASRRGFLAALSAFAGAGAAGGAAIAAPARLEPDAELVAAELRWNEARAALRGLEIQYDAAARAEEIMLGRCPPELMIGPDWEWRFIEALSAAGCEPRYENWFDHDRESGHGRSWTVASLNTAIALMPAHYGRAGRTPFRIRHLRELIPLAEERDALERRAERRFGAEEIGRAIQGVQEKVSAAEDQILDIPARSFAGVVVKARYTQESTLDHARRGAPALPRQDCLLAVLGAVLDVAGVAPR